jgi:hypothetical protein
VTANAYKWVRARFTEGADEEVTARWLELLHTSMGETETLEDYYNRKVALFNALKGNGHSIMEREAKLAIIKGLPEEAKETGMISSSAGKDLEGLWEIISTTAKGLGFNDQVPRVTPVARAAITPAHFHHTRDCKLTGDPSWRPGGPSVIGQGGGTGPACQQALPLLQQTRPF